jgi:hypothetical protein
MRLPKPQAAPRMLYSMQQQQQQHHVPLGARELEASLDSQLVHALRTVSQPFKLIEICSIGARKEIMSPRVALAGFARIAQVMQQQQQLRSPPRNGNHDDNSDDQLALLHNSNRWAVFTASLMHFVTGKVTSETSSSAAAAPSSYCYSAAELVFMLDAMLSLRMRAPFLCEFFAAVYARRHEFSVAQLAQLASFCVRIAAVTAKSTTASSSSSSSDDSSALLASEMHRLFCYVKQRLLASEQYDYDDDDDCEEYEEDDQEDKYDYADGELPTLRDSAVLCDLAWAFSKSQQPRSGLIEQEPLYTDADTTNSDDGDVLTHIMQRMVAVASSAAAAAADDVSSTLFAIDHFAVALWVCTQQPSQPAAVPAALRCALTLRLKTEATAADPAANDAAASLAAYSSDTAAAAAAGASMLVPWHLTSILSSLA